MIRKKNHPSERRRRGAIMTTAVLTAVVVLLAIGVNWLAAVLESRHALSADLSFNALTLQSAVTEEELAGLDRDIDLYLLTAATADTFGDSLILRQDLRTILERYRSMSVHITLHEESLLQSPTWSTRFSEGLGGQAITEDCVVAFCEATGRARMLTSDDFVQMQYDLDSQDFVVSAYAVEKALTEGIVYVSNDTVPVVQMLTGHGELGEGDTAVLESHLQDAGYTVARVTLHDEDSLDRTQPLLVMSPQFDLTEREAELLTAYLDAGGGLLYMTSYTSPAELPRFSALLRGFGLGVSTGIVVADGGDRTSYYNDSPVSLLPYMQATPETHELLTNGQDILLIPGSRAVTIHEDRELDIYAESLLKSGSAYLRAFEDGLETLDRQEGDEEGIFDLAALARRYNEDGAGATVIVIGNTGMFTEEWIYENTYQDAFLKMLLKALGTEQPVSLDISVKSAARAGLSLGSLSWAVWAAAMLPLLVIAAALVVLLPRRHL